MAMNGIQRKQDNEFEKLEDTILTEVLVDNLLTALNKLKTSTIDTSSIGSRSLLNVMYLQMYCQKKELISQYINCTDFQENDRNVRNKELQCT